MTSESTKYVFSQLVSQNDNPYQLLAYAIYKQDKDSAARRMLAANPHLTADQLRKELSHIHDVVANNTGIQAGFHQRAEAVGEVLVSHLKDKIRKNAVQDFIGRIDRLSKTERALWVKIIAFIGEGLRGTLATLTLIVLASGLFALTLPQQERGLVWSATAETVIESVNGSVPFWDRYRTSLAELKSLQAERDKIRLELQQLLREKMRLQALPSPD